MLRGTLLTRQFNNTASEANMNNSLAGAKGGRGGGRGGKWHRGGDWIVIVPEVRQSSESVTSRGIYMEIPYAFGETCLSPRLVSFPFPFRETRACTAAYIKGDPSNQLRETSLASFLGKLHPRTLRRGVLLHSRLSIPFAFLTLRSGPFRSRYLFCLDRSPRSLIPHSDSALHCQIVLTPWGKDTEGDGGFGEFRSVAATNNVY